MTGHMTEEFNFQKIAAWTAVIAIGSIALVVALVGIASSAASANNKPDEEAVAARIVPVAKVKLAAATAASGEPRTGEALYNSACAACHGTGAAGAPKVGDNGAWGARLGQGLAGLIKTATAGKGAMPPKGGAGDASELELARAIVYMANKSGGKLVEPKP